MSRTREAVGRAPWAPSAFVVVLATSLFAAAPARGEDTDGRTATRASKREPEEDRLARAERAEAEHAWDHIRSIAIKHHAALRAGFTTGGGTRPLWVSPESSYATRQYGAEFRAASALEPLDSSSDGERSDLGSAFGMEVSLAAFYSEEEPVLPGDSPFPFEVVGSVGLAAGLFTLGSAKWLALIVHANPEVGWGGQHWWSDTPRLGVFAGPRLLLDFGKVASELDYSFLPDYWTGSPADVDVARWEHRLSAVVAIGRFGLGVRHVIASERTRTPFPDVLQSHATSTFAFLELRLGR